MDKKRQFNDALSAIVELAGTKGNSLTADEIHDAFADVITDDAMYRHIFDYLAENKISITGYLEQASKAKPNTQKKPEQAFVEMYKQDLRAIPSLSAEEELLLLKQLKNGLNTSAKLAECNLHLVMNLITAYEHSGVPTGDLIQEGNLGLLEGIFDYADETELSTFHDYLEQCIHNALRNAVNEQNGSDRVGKHIADRANALDHASKELAQDLEREPTLAELAQYLSLSEEEVEKIVKISLDALTIEGEGAVSETEEDTF